jgi:hypothetical protein
MHKPFKGICAYEWQIGPFVMQFCYNNVWNWRKYGTFWRFNFFKV